MAQEDEARAIAQPGVPLTDLGSAVRRLPTTESNAWTDGLFAGAIGAAVIAVFFLAVDLAEGVPLRTPGALGSELLLGRPLDAGAPPSLALVLGYTVLHAVMFVTAGVVASFALIGRSKELGPLFGLGLAAALFAGLEAFFLTLVALAAPELITDFGAGRIATANMLAAGAMSVALLRPHRDALPLLRRRVVVGVMLALMFSTLFLVYWCSSAYVDVAR
jgi:hypothetical protein